MSQNQMIGYNFGRYLEGILVAVQDSRGRVVQNPGEEPWAQNRVGNPKNEDFIETLNPMR